VLGHSPGELARLSVQAQLFDEETERLLVAAGVRRGMRVVDLGSGAGDVALVAARLVGPGGEVIGVEQAAAAVAAARERIQSLGVRNVRFVERDLNAFTLDRPADAVVGRLVLMYQADQVAAIRHAAAQVRPGGLIAFHEMDFGIGLESAPPCGLWDRHVELVRETFRRGGIDIRSGFHLRRRFIEAGLSRPQAAASARLEGGIESPAWELLAATVRSLLPMMERLGLATAADLDPKTLADRLRQAGVATGSTVMAPLLAGVWARR
jgi:SAM-dependent methyltransferase